jgi:hypothetical protein
VPWNFLFTAEKQNSQRKFSKKIIFSEEEKNSHPFTPSGNRRPLQVGVGRA